MNMNRYLIFVLAAAGLVSAGCDTTLTPGEDSVDPEFESAAGAKLVAIGDVNGDGLDDVVSFSDESQHLQIHLQTLLSSSFDTYTIAGGAPLTKAADLAMTDLNGDGRLDIIVLAGDTSLAETGDPGALILLIQGTDPTSATSWTQVPGPGETVPDKMSFADGQVSDVAFGDIDGINGPDIVVATNDAIRVFENPGNSTATDKTAWVPKVIELDVVGLAKAGVTDLDGDGDQDVVVCDPGAASFNLRWMENPLIGGTGVDEPEHPTYASDEVDPLFESTAGAKAAAIGDIDGDGVFDVASISDENQDVQIHLRNATTEKFDTVSIAGGGPLALMVDIELADLDGDGDLDMAVLANDAGFVAPGDAVKPGALVLLIQSGDPRSPASWTQVDPDGGCYADPIPAVGCDMIFESSETGATDLAVGDFTGDGLPDIAVASNEVQVDENDPFTFVHLFTNPGASQIDDDANWVRQSWSNMVEYSRLAMVDIDGDGDLDVIASTPESKTWNLHWLRNNGNGTSWSFGGIGHQDGGAEFIGLGDIDGDGYLDVAASSVGHGLTQWFRNPAPPASGTQSQVPWDVFNIGELDGDINQMQLVDLDGDNLLDCFVTTGDKAFGFLRQSDVEHVWDSFSITETDPPAEIGRVAFADFDGDGQPDFLAPLDRDGLTEDRIVIYYSVASSQWERRLVGQQYGGADFLALGDIDGDGNVDVAASSVASSLVQWFCNPGAGSLGAGAAQVPWEVFNIGGIDDLGLDLEASINQMQLVDLDNDGTLDCFMTASGFAFEFYPPSNAKETWTGSPMFKTDPAAEIGLVGFLDLNGNNQPDIIAPIDRDGLTQDQVIIFDR